MTCVRRRRARAWRGVLRLLMVLLRFFFFFNDPATTEIYTLSLHDALPISDPTTGQYSITVSWNGSTTSQAGVLYLDRKSTRLNSSHANISYAVFCLKKKTSSITGPKTPRR